MKLTGQLIVYWKSPVNVHESPTNEPPALIFAAIVFPALFAEIAFNVTSSGATMQVYEALSLEANVVGMWYPVYFPPPPDSDEELIRY
jgi:hypothetical protein